MTKGSLIEQLNDAVEAVMADPRAPLPGVNPRIAALLRIAADLRGLPSEAFKTRLKAELLCETDRSSTPTADVSIYGRPLVTEEDIYARLEELAAASRLVAYDVGSALSGLPDLTMRFLASLNQCTIGVSRSSTAVHWERHPAGDEMLHILEGEADLVTLTADGPVHSTVRAGSIFICPQGLWHQLRPRSPLSLLFATPGEGTEATTAKDPRRTGGNRKGLRQGGGRRRKAAPPTLVAHDLGAALSGLPELVITSRTTSEEANAAPRTITSLGPCTLGVMRYSGLTPWERHPDGDELLHAIEGEVDVTVLTDAGPVRTTVRAGSVFVCPRGLWHRQLPRPSVTMLYGTPTETTEVSFAEDPRDNG